VTMSWRATLRPHLHDASNPIGQGLIVTCRARTAPVTTSSPVTPAIDIAVYKGAPNVPVKPSATTNRVYLFISNGNWTPSGTSWRRVKNEDLGSWRPA